MLVDFFMNAKNMLLLAIVVGIGFMFFTTILKGIQLFLTVLIAFFLLWFFSVIIFQGALGYK